MIKLHLIKPKTLIKPLQYNKKLYSSAVPDYKGYTPVIGLEIHAQLNSKKKLFSNGSVTYNPSPNEYLSPIDLSYPGYLPILNKTNLTQAIKLILSLSGKVNLKSQFDRKHYFYPDLSQGYQITQKFNPIGSGGKLSLNWLDGNGKKNEEEIIINIDQIQLEQDTAHCQHLYSSSETLINYNRMGAPLVEIVTQPDIKTPKQAGQFVTKMRALLRSLNISDGNMEEGSLRCDVNVSIHKPGEPFGNRVELKNLGSIRILMQAIECEILRQIELKEQGVEIEMETRGFNPQSKSTHLLRSKESAPDYRYLPEADLPTIKLNQSQVNQIRDKLEPSPDELKLRLIEQYGLKLSDCNLLAGDKEILNWFENLVKIKPSSSVNSLLGWLNSTLIGVLNQENYTLSDNRITLTQFSKVIELVENNTINKSRAKLLIIEIIKNNDKRENVSEILGLKEETNTQSASDSQDLTKLFDKLIAENEAQVNSIREGNLGKLNWLLGQFLKSNKGLKLNPKVIKEELVNYINGTKKD